MSIFLAVVVFIFFFISGILSPFSQGRQADAASSNRVADQLVKKGLASSSEPFVLDWYCTVGFFANGSQDNCQYDDVPPDQQLGLDGFQNVNIITEKEGDSGSSETEILCWDTDNGLVDQSVPACDLSAGGTPLKRGDPLSEGPDDSVTSQRMVSLNREDVILYVKTW